MCTLHSEIHERGTQWHQFTAISPHAAGLAVAGAVLWAAANELLIQPKEYTCFNLALERIRYPQQCLRLLCQRASCWHALCHCASCRYTERRASDSEVKYQRGINIAPPFRRRTPSDSCSSCKLAASWRREDPRVTVRLGTPISAYGQESRNRAARQRIPHRAYTDSDGVEHHHVRIFDSQL